MRFLFTCISIILVSALTAQDTLSDLKIGEWQQHLPWQRAKSVTNSASKVYYATELSVVEIDKAERSTQFLYKNIGFSGVGVRLVRFSKKPL